MNLAVSRCLALCIGALLPVAEIYRRWHQLGDLSMLPAWMDDVLIGAFLLYGWWRTRDRHDDGRIWLAGAWTFLLGMAYPSFFMQLAALGEPDPSGAPPVIVVAIKGAGLLVGGAGFLLTLRSTSAREKPG